MSALACALNVQCSCSPATIRCQSIMSALACALAILTLLRLTPVLCQSIMSALACALVIRLFECEKGVSVSRS